MTDDRHVQIKELADRSGASDRSIRHYEAAGLIASTRGHNGYRCFDEAAVTRVRNIKALLAVGLTIEDVRAFDCCLDGDVITATPDPSKIELARARLETLQRRRDALATACATLEAALESRQPACHE